MDDNQNQDKAVSEADRIRSQTDDGNQEHDNSQPRWWMWLFCFAIIFAVVYMFYFKRGPGENLNSELTKDLAQQNQPQPGEGQEAQKDLASMAADQKVIASGKVVYSANCVPCHGPQGQGVIGPNLTDEYWLHGSDAESIHNAIAKGILNKGMPAWLGVLGAEKTLAVSAYLLTIKNTNIPGKEPQGVK